MKRSRFTEEQIIGIWKEHEGGVSVAICAGSTASAMPTSTNGTKFGEMEVSEAKRRRTLEDENTRPKRLLADAMLDNVALKDLLGRSGGARGQAESCRPSRGCPRDERTAGV